MVRDDGTILINGQTGATVMINGKPTYLSGSSLAGYLQTIPASSIGKIELVSTPSAQYDAGGKTGLIKIEMSKNTTQGIMVGTIRSNTSFICPLMFPQYTGVPITSASQSFISSAIL